MARSGCLAREAEGPGIGSGAGPAGDGADADVVRRLLEGDASTFAGLVERYHGRFLRLAGAVVGDRAAAEEVVQDTWMAILEGLPRFECRCSLRGWMYRILVNRSRTRRAREGRSVAFSRLRPVEGEAEADPLDGGDRGAGRWEERSPEALLAGAETRRAVESAISRLPPSQRAVLTLRDVEGLETEEICRALGITPANQRVLLHRARTRVRAALEAA